MTWGEEDTDRQRERHTEQTDKNIPKSSSTTAVRKGRREVAERHRDYKTTTTTTTKNRNRWRTYIPEQQKHFFLFRFGNYSKPPNDKKSGCPTSNMQ